MPRWREWSLAKEHWRLRNLPGVRLGAQAGPISPCVLRSMPSNSVTMPHTLRLPATPSGDWLLRLLPSTGRRVLFLVVLATLLGGVFAMQSVVLLPAERVSREWRQVLMLQLACWYIWVALAPLAVKIGSRIRSNTVVGRSLAWVTLAVAFAALHTALFMASYIVIERLRGELGPFDFTGGWWWHFQRSIAQDLLSFALVVAVYQVLQSDRREREREQRESELSMRLATAEVGLLRMQLQPHFLFNALNTVSSLMETNTDSARTLLANVGDLFRLSLERLGRPVVRLDEEIDFAGRYLDIQRVRFGDRVRVEVFVETGLEDAKVPSLVLQPLVENAVLHGVEPRRGTVTVAITARRDGDRLHLSVEDDGAGPTTGANLSRGTGIGLSNTARRLQQMYGDDSRMIVTPGTSGGYRVVVTIPNFNEVAEGEA